MEGGGGWNCLRVRPLFAFYVCAMDLHPIASLLYEFVRAFVGPSGWVKNLVTA